MPLFLPAALLAALAGLVPPAVAASAPAPFAQAGLDRATAAAIAERINAYRQSRGLPAIASSRSMTQVAEAHALDISNSPDGGASYERGRDSRGLPCNLHSWSARGAWTPVCYTADHRYAQAMWDKPREITGVYRDYGFEIGHWSGGAVTAQGAVENWKSSSAHHAVIAELDIWKGANWQAMGVGVSGHVAFVWFGKVADPQR